MPRALPRRRRYAAAHLSVTLRVPPLLKERLWGAPPEGKAPLEGRLWAPVMGKLYVTAGVLPA